MLTMELLYLVALIAGMFTLVFDVAYQAFLPTVVRREHLVEANSKFAQSGAAAELAGPSVAGSLVHLLTAPLAVTADALS